MSHNDFLPEGRKNRDQQRLNGRPSALGPHRYRPRDLRREGGDKGPVPFIPMEGADSGEPLRVPEKEALPLPAETPEESVND